MTQITRVPTGLQDFLGTQAQGDNPSEFGQTIIPVLDMFPFYAQGVERWEDVGGLFSVDTGLNIDVPAGETWLLLSWSVEMDGGGAGGSFNMGVIMTQVPQAEQPTINHPISTRVINFTDQGAGTSVWYAGDHFPIPILAQSDVRVTFWFKDVSGTNFNPICHLRYWRLRT